MKIQVVQEKVDMAAQGKFRKDLARGVKAELYVAKRLQKEGFEVVRNISNKLSELQKWDLRLKKNGVIETIEVKNDIMSMLTGNIGLEIGQDASNKPSCLLKTKADFWCHIFYAKEEAFISIMDTALLRQKVLTAEFYADSCFRNKGRFIANVGDNNADIIILSIDTYLDIFEGTFWCLSLQDAIKEGFW